MVEANLMGMIGAFIALSIMLGIATQILGGSVTDCTGLPGYDANTEANSTGWAKQCIDNNASTQSAFALLVIVLIVVAAVVILTVIKML